MHLRNRLVPAAILAGLVCSCGAAAAEGQLPKAEEILDKFVDASGGKAAYDKVHNEKWSGTFEFLGKGIKGAITSYRSEPNKSVSVVELEGVGTIQDGTDGETAWTLSSLQGARIKQGDERATTMREATFRGLLEWRKMYKHAETSGVETIDDQACYKIVLTPNEGKPETRYFDKKNGLLVKVNISLASPMGEIPTETTLSEYKEQNGLLSPHKIQQKAMGQEFLITINKVEYNVDIPKDRFDLPADVKALTSK
jgi:outer membrane lipoprotein-sorting protein